MNKYLKLVLFGLLIWAVPFFASFFIWNVETNAPSVSYPWFYAIMTFTGAIVLAISACSYFTKINKNTIQEGWIAGIIWYFELVLLDLIFLVGLFKMPLSGYAHLPLVYLNALIVAVTIGYIKK